MSKERKINPIIKIVVCFFSLLIVLVTIAVACFSIGEAIIFRSFYSRAEAEFKIPGLWGNSVPQGFEYIEARHTFLYTGYSKDKVSPSMVYIMPSDGEGKPSMVELYDGNGKAFTSHVGGISVYNDCVYIADGDEVAIFSLSDILDGDGRALKQTSFEVGFGVAFVEVKGSKIYCGNFYRAVDYETPASHHITTPNGDKNTAIIVELELESTGMVDSEPTRAFSITDAIQGMTFGAEGEIILSSSWGLSKSHIYVYDTALANTGSFALDSGKEIPLTFLDSACLKDDIIAPPMAEEIVYDDGDIYIIGEAASMKYLFGKLTAANYVYSYEYR